jgi:biopolymer transport protein TolQ
MQVNIIFLNINPFFDAYSQSDLLGKLIFLGLYFLSICSWSILVFKIWTTFQAKKNAREFQQLVSNQKINILNLENEKIIKKSINPFYALYQVFKKQSLELLAKNRHFSQQKGDATSFLSLSDIDFIAAHLAIKKTLETKNLEKQLYLLSTIVTLAPFLGLLGTVWGILVTFSEMQTHTAGSTHQMVLGGLSLALATTVLGLLDAIPALIGYNYLKNSVRDFSTDMESFSNEILATVELQYRQVELIQ